MDLRKSQRRQRCGICKREGHNRRLYPYLTISQMSQHDIDSVDDDEDI